MVSYQIGIKTPTTQLQQPTNTIKTGTTSIEYLRCGGRNMEHEKGWKINPHIAENVHH